MGNKSIGTKSDPLVLVPFKILQSQKDFVNTQGNASAFIRKLIDAQMDTHQAEISRLKEERRGYEAHIKLIDAQINELEASEQKQQAASQGRAELIEQIAQKLKGDYVSWKGITPELARYVKNNVFDVNQRLDGSGEHIQEREVLDRIIQINEAEEVAV